MKIINPIYDKAFKYLMQNEKYARKVLSVILDTEVKVISIGQQEIIYTDESKQLSLFRLDFKATILQEDGEEKTVLIELQKSKYLHDLYRFRNYLGRHYLSGEKKDAGQPYDTIYPIVTIYLLGYNLLGIPYLGIKSGQVITNLATREGVDIEDSFMKYLTHESYLIQVRRLPEDRKSRLDHFFTLFNQAWVAEEDYLLDLEEVPDEFTEIAQYLHNPVLDEGFRRQLELEEEVTRGFERMEEKLIKAEAREKEAKEREEEAKKREEEAREREEEARKREEAAKKREAEAQKREAEAWERERQLIVKLSESLSVQQIAQMTSRPVHEIEAMLKRP